MNNFIRDAEKCIAKTYNRFPVVIQRGHGTKVFDTNNKEYTDFVAGIAVNNIGHTHPDFVRAIGEQTKKLIHCSNLYYNKEQVHYAQKLINYLPKGLTKLFFCNSGTEAIEGAIKLARKATGKQDIIYMQNSFHGRTFGALSATGTDRYQDPFKPLVPGFHRVAFKDSTAVKNAMTENTAAVLLEPIQGEGGVDIPKREYLLELKKICDENNVLLIFDEVQTGFGRCGSFFASSYFEVIPDILTMGKAIAGGVPMGVIAAKSEIMDKFVPGDHASTFGGNALACSAASVVLDIIEKEHLVLRSKEMGAYFLGKLKKYEKSPLVKEIRGLGLMIALELHEEALAKKIVFEGLNAGFLLNQTAKTVLRFVPPLIISKEEIESLITFLDTYLLQ